MRWVRHVSILGAVVGLVAAGLAGCSDGQKPPVAPMSPDIAAWALPLDPYLVTRMDIMWEEYAVELLAQECLHDSDVTYPPIRPEHSTAASATLNARDRRLFSKESAARFGYKMAPSAEEDEEIRQFHSRSGALAGLSDADLVLYYSCMDAAKHELGVTLLDKQVANEIALSRPSSLQTEAVLETIEAWRQCLVAAGIVVDSDVTPVDMPTDEIERAIAVAGDGGEEGRRIASSDAECRDSSGYTQAAYQSEWSQQEEVLRENSRELAEVHSQVAAALGRIWDVINELDPQ